MHLKKKKRQKMMKQKKNKNSYVHTGFIETQPI